MLKPWRLVEQHIYVSTKLLLKFGAPLSAVWAGGILANLFLTMIAVEIGLVSRIAGMIALVPVLLLQLLIFVAMFLILRNGLPNIRLQRRRWLKQEARKTLSANTEEYGNSGRVFAGALLAVLLPFYAYYAGWGLLNNTLRQYSQAFLNAQMQQIDFTNPQLGPAALEVDSTVWVIVAVFVIWAIRRVAKSFQSALR